MKKENINFKIKEDQQYEHNPLMKEKFEKKIITKQQTYIVAS